jgi:hypothetical protein
LDEVSRLHERGVGADQPKVQVRIGDYIRRNSAKLVDFVELVISFTNKNLTGQGLCPQDPFGPLQVGNSGAKREQKFALRLHKGLIQ